MTAALELVQASVTLGGRPVLRGISCAVRRGERLVVVGASGAGKTTLLRVIAGLSPLSSGQVQVRGADVTALPPERRGVVYLHQTPLLFPHLDVLDNVAFPLVVRGIARDAARRQATGLLDAVRLGDFRGRMPQTLSGGERHRTALARAVAARPEVLLLDEPFAALDPALRADVRDTVMTVVAAFDTALILVTHDIADAAVVADRIAVLTGGAFAQLDTPAALFARPGSLAVARLLGIPNILAGEIDAAGSFRCGAGSVPAPHLAPGAASAAFGFDGIVPCVNGVLACVAAVRHLPGGRIILLEIAGTQVQAALPAMPGLGIGDAIAVSLDPGRVALVRD